MFRKPDFEDVPTVQCGTVFRSGAGLPLCIFEEPNLTFWLCLQIVGVIYETEEGLGGGEEEGDDDDDDPDRPEEPEVENDPAPPPDYDPDQDQDDDEETIILDEEEEGPEEEGAGGGHVDPVGATGTTPASVSSEVREAINQALPCL